MFYLSFLKAELTRRLGKTVAISLGLAISSAIIVVIVSTANSLSASQKKVLNPLESVGTDMLVTRSVDSNSVNQLDAATRDELRADNAINIDLSKLGKPGESFSHDTFLLGNQLSFNATDSAKLNQQLVANYAAGLIVNVSHQEGKIPEIVAQFQTGGQRIQFNQDAPQLTDAEQQALDDARTKAMQELQQKGIDPRSQEGRQYIRSAIQAATPDRVKKITGEVVVPQQTFRQQVDTPQTDIKTESLVLAGVDTTKKDIGLILPNQITQGSYFSSDNQAIVNVSYAQKKSLKVGDTVTFNTNKYTIVGLVDPKLYTNTADVYLSLTDLQKLTDKTGKVNILLVKASNANNVEATSTSIAGMLPGIKVTNSSDTAKQVTGSLVDASNLTNKFIGLVSIIVIVASFIIVSLLSLISVNKRVREIGTLKALGWNNMTIVRQLFFENITLGLVGGLLGIAIGIGIIALINHYNISLNANIASLNAAQNALGRFGFGGFRGGNQATTPSLVSTQINLQVSYSYMTLIIGCLIAVVGSILAGTLAAMKAARMRPQDALRSLE
jgi:ABC-type lipoprotein release transport system permease subunit